MLNKEALMQPSNKTIKCCNFTISLKILETTHEHTYLIKLTGTPSF